MIHNVIFTLQNGVFLYEMHHFLHFFIVNYCIFQNKYVSLHRENKKTFNNLKKITIMTKDEISELFDEYEIDTIPVSDFDIQFQGVRVDNIHRDENGNISIWGGNPDTDNYAEELLPSKEEKRQILELILEYMS